MKSKSFDSFRFPCAQLSNPRVFNKNVYIRLHSIVPSHHCAHVTQLFPQILDRWRPRHPFHLLPVLVPSGIGVRSSALGLLDSEIMKFPICFFRFLSSFDCFFPCFLIVPSRSTLRSSRPRGLLSVSLNRFATALHPAGSHEPKGRRFFRGEKSVQMVVLFFLRPLR